jgi:hypothetical protein
MLIVSGLAKTAAASSTRGWLTHKLGKVSKARDAAVEIKSGRNDVLTTGELGENIVIGRDVLIALTVAEIFQDDESSGGKCQ